MAKTISELKTQADIVFLTAIALEGISSKKISAQEKQEIESCFSNLKEKGAIPQLIESGIKETFQIYKAFHDGPITLPYTKIKRKKELYNVRGKNKALITYLQNIVKEQSISIKVFQSTEFFINILKEHQLAFGSSDDIYDSFLNDLIDIFQSCPISEKTSFITNFIKEKIANHHHFEMIGYFFDNIDSARFKNNFNFSPVFLSLMLKTKLKRDAGGSWFSLSPEVIQGLTDSIEKFGLPKTEFEKCLRLVSFFNKSSEKGAPSDFLGNDLDDHTTITEVLDLVNEKVATEMNTISAIMDYAQAQGLKLSQDTKNTLYSNAILYLGAGATALTDTFNTFYDEKMEMADEDGKVEFILLQPRELEASLSALSLTLERLQQFAITHKTKYLGQEHAKKFKEGFSPIAVEKKIISILKKDLIDAGCDTHLETVEALGHKLELNHALLAKKSAKEKIKHKI